MTACRLRALVCMLLLALSTLAHAAMSGMPAPVAIAPGVYAFFGDNDAVAPANHGIVSNNGFIVGQDGVTVIDTGSSYRYGRAMIEAIRKVTPLPVKLVIITHQAPEFVFGAAAFRDDDVPILAHARAAQLIRERCAICLANLRKTLGEDEMAGSRVTVPDKTVNGTTEIESGGRKLQLLHFGPASTPGDLAVLDTQTGVLFAGGLVSNGRIPELRNEQIPGWLAALENLHALDLKTVVPGFGAPLRGDDIMRTGDYLRELDVSVKRAYKSGIGLTEAMHTVQVPAFKDYKLYAIAQPQNVQRIYLQLEKQ
ncbi:MBL fold metallo-hydrolase [Caballeronia sp. LZ029]|uniref:MBL fold metallo-hydrolase n=1 Tax=Caballeronia sp. LZ029 TaxID=3038564 RepID=UPI00285A69F5|nr:MBL fold metallo-hydrolase [Caballeronia sp. LZ029]MDR5746702.1 MBL fold metallo-hydrolase [Caballeronia sp. LZ029]